mmetsp:Transcript_42664/g.85615  ORF Transcript_42664/g.85615 Transcript_42664/m.85615 type:complete len:314 (-) Transcript_42664:545-1486(-)
MVEEEARTAAVPSSCCCAALTRAAISVLSANASVNNRCASFVFASSCDKRTTSASPPSALLPAPFAVGAGCPSNGNWCFWPSLTKRLCKPRTASSRLRNAEESSWRNVETTWLGVLSWLPSRIKVLMVLSCCIVSTSCMSGIPPRRPSKCSCTRCFHSSALRTVRGPSGLSEGGGGGIEELEVELQSSKVSTPSKKGWASACEAVRRWSGSYRRRRWARSTASCGVCAGNMRSHGYAFSLGKSSATQVARIATRSRSDGVPRSFMISTRCCCVESCPWNGRWPSNNSMRMVPTDHTSTETAYSVAPNMSSGAR